MKTETADLLMEGIDGDLLEKCGMRRTAAGAPIRTVSRPVLRFLGTAAGVILCAGLIVGLLMLPKRKKPVGIPPVSGTTDTENEKDPGTTDREETTGPVSDTEEAGDPLEGETEIPGETDETRQDREAETDETTGDPGTGETTPGSTGKKQKDPPETTKEKETSEDPEETGPAEGSSVFREPASGCEHSFGKRTVYGTASERLGGTYTVCYRVYQKTCTLCGGTVFDVVSVTQNGDTTCRHGRKQLDREGLHFCYCSACHFADKVSPHSYTASDAVIMEEATDRRNGLAWYTCSSCGYVLQTATPKTHHTCTYGKYTADKGGHQKCCTKCGAVTLPEAHTFGPWKMLVDPLCNRKGELGKTCTVCGYTYRLELPKATGHIPSVPREEPTCTESGWLRKTNCVNCGKILFMEDEEIPPLGHDFKAGICTRCGAEKENCQDGLEFIRYGDGYSVICIDPERTEVVIPSHYNGLPVVKIGPSAFFNTVSKAQKTVSVSIPETVTEIDAWAFRGCQYLENIDLPAGLVSLGESCFEGCTRLKKVTVPEGITALPKYCFYACTDMTEVILPDTLRSIGASCFNGCWSLTSIELPDTLTELEPAVFYHCSKLREISVPDGVTSLPSLCFYDCISLTRIFLPSGLKSVGSECFAGCTVLSEVVFDGLLASLDPSAFKDCTLLKDLPPVG